MFPTSSLISSAYLSSFQLCYLVRFFSLLFCLRHFLFITQAGFELLIFLLQPLKYWDYKCTGLNMFLLSIVSYFEFPISLSIDLLTSFQSGLLSRIFKKAYLNFSFIALYFVCLYVCVPWCSFEGHKTTWSHFCSFTMWVLRRELGSSGWWQLLPTRPLQCPYKPIHFYTILILTGVFSLLSLPPSLCVCVWGGGVVSTRVKVEDNPKCQFSPSTLLIT